ncbi:hypothetical protein Hanom_Chr12g01156261 [Helianthus anomalus]
MTTPKGLTKWKMKYFYVKEATITCRLHFRNVSGNIAGENISVPEVGNQDWVEHLQDISLKTLGNKELRYLRMMLWNKSSVMTKLVLKENNQDFEGKIEVVACSEGEEGWYETTVENFRLPNQAALDAPLLQAKGTVFMHVRIILLSIFLSLEMIVLTACNLGAMGNLEGRGVKSATAVIVVEKKKKT